MSRSPRRFCGCVCGTYTTGIRFAKPGGTAQNDEQTANVLSVRKVSRNQPFSRYPQIHYYTLYISLSISKQTYCTEYETLDFVFG
jgi:hypothetical protein